MFFRIPVWLAMIITVSFTLNACFSRDATRSPGSAAEPGPIPVELTTHLGDRQTFVEGDEIQFLLSLGSDAYIYMYYIDADGNVSQILPNVQQPGHHYAAGYFMTLPEYENGYRFIVRPPFGEESVWVFASDVDMDLASGLSLENIRQRIKSGSRRYGEAQLRINTQKS